MIMSLVLMWKRLPLVLLFVQKSTFADGFCSLITTSTTLHLNYDQLHTNDFFEVCWFCFYYHPLTVNYASVVAFSFVSADERLIAFIILILKLELNRAEEYKKCKENIFLLNIGKCRRQSWMFLWNKNNSGFGKIYCLYFWWKCGTVF